MKRTALFLSLLVLVSGGTGCGGRSGMISGSGDGGVTPTPDGKVTPTRCTSLRQAGQANLEFADSMKMSPRVVWDGKRFATVWHTQPGIISSMNGELRLARVDGAGKADKADGVSLGSDDGIMPLAAAAADERLALVHRPVTNGVDPRVERRLIDFKAGTSKNTEIKGRFTHAAIIADGPGHTLLLAEGGGVPMLYQVTENGGVTPGGSIITAQVMAALWLGKRPGGYAAMLHTTNSNATLHLLNEKGKSESQTGVGSGAMIPSAGMTSRPAGFASIHLTSAGKVEVEVFNSLGKQAGKTALATAQASKLAPGRTELVWTGEQLIALYPSAVTGQYRVRLLSGEGKAEGKEIQLPNCLALTNGGVSATWGNGRLAVAAVNSASGVPKSSVCVTVMECI